MFVTYRHPPCIADLKVKLSFHRPSQTQTSPVQLYHWFLCVFDAFKVLFMDAGSLKHFARLLSARDEETLNSPGKV